MDSAGDQWQRGAAASVAAPVEAGGAYWSRTLWGGDGRLSGPMGEQLEEELREELEMRSLPELRMQGREPVCLKAWTGESSVSDQPGTGGTRTVPPLVRIQPENNFIPQKLYFTGIRRGFPFCEVGEVSLKCAGCNVHYRCRCVIKTFFNVADTDSTAVK